MSQINGLLLQKQAEHKILSHGQSHVGRGSSVKHVSEMALPWAQQVGPETANNVHKSNDVLLHARAATGALYIETAGAIKHQGW